MDELNVPIEIQMERIKRIAFTHSLYKDRKLDLKDVKDSGGKEYSKSILFGDYENIYIGLICTHYDLCKTDKIIPKYIKPRIDEGLELLDKELRENPKFDRFYFLTDKINSGLQQIK